MPKPLLHSNGMSKHSESFYTVNLTLNLQQNLHVLDMAFVMDSLRISPLPH